MIKIRLLLILLSTLPFSVAAQTLIEGKLFSSPEQRQYLDYLRKDYLVKNKQTKFNLEDSDIPEIPGSTPGVVGPEEYSLDAIMARADGRTTIWLNHKPMTEQQLPSNFRLVREGNSLALKVVTAGGRTQLLRPGQTIDITSGVLQERSHKPAPAKDSQKPAPGAADTAADNKSAQKNDDGAAEAKAAADSVSKNLQQATDAATAGAGKELSAAEKIAQTLKMVREVLDANKKP